MAERTNATKPSGPFTLAVCAEMVFRERPIDERVRRIPELGSRWRSGTGPSTTSTPGDTGATFSSMTGYVAGTLAEPTAPTSCCAPPGRRSRSRSGWAARG